MADPSQHRRAADDWNAKQYLKFAAHYSRCSSGKAFVILKECESASR